MKIKFTYLFIIFTLISSNDFGFYYDNSKDAIYLDPKYNNSESIIPNTNSWIVWNFKNKIPIMLNGFKQHLVMQIFLVLITWKYAAGCYSQ